MSLHANTNMGYGVIWDIRILVNYSREFRAVGASTLPFSLYDFVDYGTKCLPGSDFVTCMTQKI